jgi:hypothetical protein
MRNLLLVLLVLGSLTSVYSQQFHSLEGIESTSGQTILLYRLGSEQHHSNPIFKFNLQTGYEQQIMDAHEIYFPIGADIKTVNDFEFFPGDTANFINVGDLIFMDYSFYIAKNDSVVFSHFAPYYKVDISKQNPEKIFVFGSGGEIRSWDGGYTFPLDSIPLIANFAPIALSDFDDEVMFGFDEELEFSRNGGVVDTSFIAVDEYFRMLYDVNQFHIYRVNFTYGGYSLNVSNNKGNAFSWTKTYLSENPIFISIDSTQSGVVYLADGKQVYKSTNNGYNLYPYKSLPSKLVGIYKKPNSEILYAASKYQLYEIRPDTTVIIKSVPIPIELFEYYPLSTGNYWIYKVTDWSYPYYSEDTFTRTVVAKETLSNNKEYFKIEEKYHNSGYTNYLYERIDSVKGLVFQFDNECENPDSEKVIDDFTAEVGDSLLIQRFTMCWDSIPTYFSEVGSESIFNEDRNFRTYEYSWLMSYTHKLAQGIGMYNIRNGYDFGESYFTLNGCVIDDIVYGDTTLTDIDDQQNQIPTEYKLEQNYPNPFNPSTKISWQSPIAGWQTLKVYNVLGREVATLVDEYRNAGSYEVEFNVSQESFPAIASGVYFYRIIIGNFIETKKMILIQ